MIRTGAEYRESIRDGTIALALTYDLGLSADVGFEPLAAAPPYALMNCSPA